MPLSLPVAEYGEKHRPTLLLIHPLGTLHQVWFPLIEHLQYDYHILAPDLWYDDLAGLTFPQMITDLAGLIADHERVHVVGTGMGGDLALCLALEHGHNIASLTLVGAILADTARKHYPETSLIRTIIRLLPERLVFQMQLAGMHYMDRDHTLQLIDGMKQLGKLGMLAQWDAYQTYELTCPLESLTLPTLLYYGGCDEADHQRDAKRLHQALPDSRLHFVKYAKRGACFDNPDAFIASLHDLIQQTTAPDVPESQGSVTELT